MPLLDHFNPPLQPRHHWESFHSNWATRIADALNDRWLPPEFMAEEHTHAGALEIDVAAYEHDGTMAPRNGNPPLVLTPPRWAPASPARTIPAVFPDTFEVRVFSTAAGLTLVGAIELISPGNKDRAEERRAFAIKCASYLHQGVSVVLIDIVTNRHANLHNETMRLMQVDPSLEMPASNTLYAASYRPVLREERPEIDLWTEPCTLGAPLPTMPLRLTGDVFIPIDFESAYQEACRHRRLTS